MEHLTSEQRDQRSRVREKGLNKLQHLVQTGQLVTGRVQHVSKNDNGTEMVYGFIRPDDSLLDDLFVHHSEIEPWRNGFKEVVEGNLVKFQIAEGKTKGKWQAVNVQVGRDDGTGKIQFKGMDDG